MKYLKNLSMVFLFALVILLGAGCKDTKKPEIVLLNNEVEIQVGDSYEIKYTITNLEGTDLVNYELDNTEVVKLDGIKLVALKAGTATLTISLKQDSTVYADLKVIVKDIPGLTLSAKQEIYVGDIIQVEAIISGIEEDTVLWEVDNEKIATIDSDGVLQTKNSGVVTVSATCGTYEASIEITVIRPPKVSIVGKNTVYETKQEQLKGTILYAEGELKWTSSDPTIATVEAGLVTGIKAGKVVITASYNEYKKDFNMTVLPKPQIEITGPLELKELEQGKLHASLVDYDGEFTWTSNNEDIVKIFPDGTILAQKEGSAEITCKAGDTEKKVTVIVSGFAEKILYDFNGGVSEELYAQNAKSGALELTNFNNNGGAFWGGGYANFIYLTDRSCDPTATFSDRIYIGKNEYTGFYEVVQVLNSGPSKWHDKAEYVVTVSSSYKDFRPTHDLIRDVEVGDVVFINGPLDKISASNPTTISFYRPDIKTDKLLVTKDKYTGTLVTPVRLGFNFMGWFDENGNEVKEIKVLDKKYTLKAKWEQLKPVTDITHTEIPSVIYPNDKLALNGKVVPNDAFFKEVIYSSSDTDVIKVDKDGNVTFINPGKAILTLKDYSGQFVKEINIVVSKVPSIDVRYDHYENGVLEVNKTIQINPTFVGSASDNLKFTYTVTDGKVISCDEAGLVKGLKEGTSEVIIKVTTDKEYTLKVGFTVKGMTTDEKIDKLIDLLAANNFAMVESGNMSLYNDGRERYYKATYGSVNRFLFDELKPNTKYVSQAVNNPRCHQTRGTHDTIEFVTVHDTATLTGTVANIANNMSSAETSIHYTVGNGEVYQVVPEEYIAWHAGDGSRYNFEWRDTKVKAKGNEAPVYDMIKDGATYYLQVNGVKTNIVVPVGNGERNIVNPTKDDFCDLKPVYTIKNGTYHVGPMWVCFSQNARGSICSQGGNNNSIGIEMCVNTTSDMYDTLQRTAMLVADIMLRNNLGMERVQKHNSWSGKNCPQVERSGNYWEDFMKMVALQYEIRKNYSDAKITMTSNNPDIVSNTGRVIKAPLTTTSVSYTVKVEIGGASKEITLYSVIPGTTVWQLWNGTYPASRVWNDGKYVR